MILILGADGFIGSTLFRALQKAGVEVIGTSFLPDPTGTLLQTDITQPSSALVEAVGIATHIICATHVGSIDECAADPIGTRRVNVEAVEQLLQHADPSAVPVYLSSNMVFAGEKDGYRETDVPDPTSEYGRQKLVMEEWIQKTFNRYLIVRLTKVYGWAHDDGTMFTSWRAAFQQNQGIRVIEDMVVAPVFVGDVVDTILKLMHEDRSGIFHISGPIADSVAQFAEQAAQAWQADLALVKKVKRADFAWKEKRSQWQTLAVSGQMADAQKLFVTPRHTFEVLGKFSIDSPTS